VLEDDAIDEPPSLSQDGFEETMPGYHEHEYADEDDPIDETEDIIEEDGQESTHRPPVSAGHSSLPTSKSAHSEHPKPHSVNKPPSKRKTSDPDDTQSLTCPICDKTLQTDNDGLNKHIDFCLSKDAIREAHASASASSSSKITGPSSQKQHKLRTGKRKK